MFCKFDTDTSQHSYFNNTYFKDVKDDISLCFSEIRFSICGRLYVIVLISNLYNSFLIRILTLVFLKLQGVSLD